MERAARRQKPRLVVIPALAVYKNNSTTERAS
jgi:hypothetical protein